MWASWLWHWPGVPGPRPPAQAPPIEKAAVAVAAVVAVRAARKKQRKLPGTKALQVGRHLTATPPRAVRPAW